MGHTAKRVVIPMRDHSAESEREALLDAITELVGYVTQQTTSRKDVAIYLPNRSNLAGSTLEEILGSKVTARLVRGDSVPERAGFDLRAEGKRTIKGHPRPQVVLAAFADRKMLEILDEISELEAIFVVPWKWDEVKPWAEKWGVETLERTSSNEGEVPHDI